MREAHCQTPGKRIPLLDGYRSGKRLADLWREYMADMKNESHALHRRPKFTARTRTWLLLAGVRLPTLAWLILVTLHPLRSVNGSTAVWKSLVQNSEADRAKDKSIASERSVGGIANRVNGHGTTTSLLWISGGIKAGGNFPAELLLCNYFISNCAYWLICSCCPLAT